MTRRIALIAIGFLVVAAMSSVVAGQAQEKRDKIEFVLDKQVPHTFSKEERQAINDYYKHKLGILAPGSLERYDPYPLEVQKALEPGGRIPYHLEKDLERLPKDLEAKLARPPAGFTRYKLGWHIVLVEKSTMRIGDIIKNVGRQKEPEE